MKAEAARTIDAPVERVFAFVSSVHEMAKAFPDNVVEIETLTEHDRGLGARFRETRLLGKKKKEDVIVLETTEYIENKRSVSETLTAGSIWRTGFQTEPKGSGTLLTLTMEAEPQSFFARLMNLVIKLGMNKGIAEEIDKVKAHLEGADVAA